MDKSKAAGKLGRKTTIGLQLTNLHDEYPKLIWQGVQDAALEQDVNIIIFRGESFDTPTIRPGSFRVNSFLHAMNAA